MASLLNSLLVTLSGLAVLEIPLQPFPLPPKKTQVPCQDESNGEVHLDISQSNFVAKQELPAALLELRSHEVKVVVDVLRQTLLGLLGVAGVLVPASIHDRDGVESESALGGVNPLQNRVPFRVA